MYMLQREEKDYDYGNNVLSSVLPSERAENFINSDMVNDNVAQEEVSSDVENSVLSSILASETSENFINSDMVNDNVAQEEVSSDVVTIVNNVLPSFEITGAVLVVSELVSVVNVVDGFQFLKIIVNSEVIEIGVEITVVEETLNDVVVTNELSVRESQCLTPHLPSSLLGFGFRAINEDQHIPSINNGCVFLALNDRFRLGQFVLSGEGVGLEGALTAILAMLGPSRMKEGVVLSKADSFALLNDIKKYQRAILLEPSRDDDVGHAYSLTVVDNSLTDMDGSEVRPQDGHLILYTKEVADILMHWGGASPNSSMRYEALSGYGKDAYGAPKTHAKKGIQIVKPTHSDFRAGLEAMKNALVELTDKLRESLDLIVKYESGDYAKLVKNAETLLKYLGTNANFKAIDSGAVPLGILVELKTDINSRRFDVALNYLQAEKLFERVCEKQLHSINPEGSVYTTYAQGCRTIELSPRAYVDEQIRKHIDGTDGKTQFGGNIQPEDLKTLGIIVNKAYEGFADRTESRVVIYLKNFVDLLGEEKGKQAYSRLFGNNSKLNTVAVQLTELSPRLGFHMYPDNELKGKSSKQPLGGENLFQFFGTQH